MKKLFKKCESITGTKAMSSVPLTTNTEVTGIVRKGHPSKEKHQQSIKREEKGKILTSSSKQISARD